MKVLILGGTGNISRQITKQLLARGDEVVLFNRGNRGLDFGPGVSVITGDKNDKPAFEAQMNGKVFDCVIDMISYNEADARSTVRAFAGNIRQLIVCSTAAAYQRPLASLPTREDCEQLMTVNDFPYGFEKANMERYLATVTEMPVTIIRPSLTFGEGAANVGALRQNYNILRRIRNDKPLVMFGDGTVPWTITFSPDLAQGFVLCILNEKTYGKSYHITSGQLQYWDQFYEEFGRYCGKKPVIYHLPSEMLFHCNEPFFMHLHLEKKFTGYFSNDKFLADVPEFKPKYTLRLGVEMLASYLDKHANTVDAEKYALEDRLCSFFEKCCKEIKTLW